MKEEKRFFTTGEIANYCGVNFRTVLRWINKGYIKAQKLPGRGDHRITLDDFIAFLNENNFEVDEILKLKKEDENRLKVLIVDDESSIVNSISRIFSMKGFEIHTADNGFKAGFLLSKERPQIITLDLNMGNLDGFDVLKIINALKMQEKIWTVVISGDQESKVEKAIELGADFYLRKPFSKEDLDKIISRVFPTSTHEELDERDSIRRAS